MNICQFKSKDCHGVIRYGSIKQGEIIKEVRLCTHHRILYGCIGFSMLQFYKKNIDCFCIKQYKKDNDLIKKALLRWN